MHHRCSSRRPGCRNVESRLEIIRGTASLVRTKSCASCAPVPSDGALRPYHQRVLSSGILVGSGSGPTPRPTLAGDRCGYQPGLEQESRDAESRDNGPLFTCVIPTFNRARFVAKAVESVLSQTFVGFELIVVDDGSRDATASVLTPYLDRITYVKKDNAERGAARNTGARRGRGRYVAFLDSDDWWLPEHLSVVADAINGKGSPPVIYTEARHESAVGLSASLHQSEHGDLVRDLIRGNFLDCNTVVIRRDAFESVGGFSEDRALAGSEDGHLWIRLAMYYPFLHVPRITSVTLIHHERSMNQVAIAATCTLAALDDLFGRPEMRPVLGRDRRVAYAGAYLFSGLACVVAGQRRRAAGNLARALGIRPLSLFDRRALRIGASLVIGERALAFVKRVLSPAP